MAALLAAIIFLAFSPVLNHEFLDWDDQDAIANNPDFNPPRLSNLAHYWTAPYLEFYVPVTYTIWGLLAIIAQTPPGVITRLDPSVFHAFNLLAHIGSTLLVFALLRQLLSAMTKSLWPAWFGALLFGLHPAQVEGVALASSMYTPLSGALALAAMWLYLRSSDLASAPVPGKHARRWIFMGLATVTFVLALLTKPAIILTPVIIAALEIGLRGRRPRDLLPLAFWLLCGGLIALVTRAAQPAGGAPAVPLFWRPLMALDAVAFYLYDLLVPYRQIPDYGRNPHWLMYSGQIWFTWAVPVALIVLCWRLWRRAPWVGVSAAIFALALFPMLGFIPFSFQRYSTVADRYLYLAMLGPALFLAVVLAKHPRRSFFAGAAFVLAGLGGLTAAQALQWHDTIRLFNYTVSVNPDSSVGHYGLGFTLSRHGKLAEALPHYQAALRTNPDDPMMLYNLGNLFLTSQRYGDAAEAYAKAIEARPGDPRLYNNLGIAFTLLHRPDDARSNYEESIRRDPAYADPHANLGNLLMNAGNAPAALAEYQTALRLDPNQAAAQKGLAILAGRQQHR